MNPKVPLYEIPMFLASQPEWPLDRQQRFAALITGDAVVHLRDLFAWLAANGYKALAGDAGLAGATTSEPKLKTILPIPEDLT